MAGQLTRLRVLIAALAALCLAGSCTADVDSIAATPTLEFEASSEFLAQAGSRTAAAPNLRFEGFSAFEVDGFSMGTRTDPATTGRVSGSVSMIEVEMGTQLPEALEGTGFSSMTAIIDGEVGYLSAPFLGLSLMDAGLEDDPSSFDWLAQIATGWGQVDLVAYGDDNILGQFSIGGQPPGLALLDLLDEAGMVADAGTGELRGASTHIAQIDVATAALVEQLGGGAGLFGQDVADFDVLESHLTSVTAHVDKRGLVRRVEFELDLGQLGTGEAELDGAVMWQRVDFFDFGEADPIEIPSDSVDVTADMIAMAGRS